MKKSPLLNHEQIPNVVKCQFAQVLKAADKYVTKRTYVKFDLDAAFVSFRNFLTGNQFFSVNTSCCFVPVKIPSVFSSYRKTLFSIIALFTLSFSSVFGQGSTYIGPYTMANPIAWRNLSNQTISGLAISNPAGDCISLINCNNITIRNCRLGTAKGMGVYLYNCKNVTITNCSMDSVASGVYAGLCSGIKISYNDVKNVIGPYPRGQMVQFAQVTGGGNYVNYNVVDNVVGRSNPEDAVNMYLCNGVAGDPIMIKGNWIRGGGPSNSGAGIQVGDGGGSHISVQENILVNPGSVGISVATGKFISVKNNKIFAKCFSFNFRGLTIRNLYTGTECVSDTIMNNEVNYTEARNILGNLLNSGACGEVIGWNTNIYNPNLNESILPVNIIGVQKQQITTSTNTSSESDYQIMSGFSTNGHIIINSRTVSGERVVLFDMNGRKVLESVLTQSRTELTTGGIPTGFYIARIINGNTTLKSVKVIVG